MDCQQGQPRSIDTANWDSKVVTLKYDIWNGQKEMQFLQLYPIRSFSSAENADFLNSM